MAGLPLLKLGGLAVKTLAKPVVRTCVYARLYCTLQSFDGPAPSQNQSMRHPPRKKSIHIRAPLDLVPPSPRCYCENRMRACTHAP